MEKKIESAHKVFFRQIIHEFLYDDLESCLKASKIKQGIIINKSINFKGGQNIIACLAIMCAIEMMAGFYKGKINANEKDVAQFLFKYFSKYESLFKDEEFSKKFYRAFRHGSVHELVPKASGVAMDFCSEASIGIINNRHGKELVCINIPAFYDLTTKSLRDYERDLDAGHYIKEFNRRYVEQIERDNKEANQLLKRYKEILKKIENV